MSETDLDDIEDREARKRREGAPGRKKKRGGLGRLLRNKEFTTALAHGLDPAAPSFTQGFTYGQELYGKQQQRRELAEQAKRQQSLLHSMTQSAPPDQRALAQLFPEQYAKSQFAAPKTSASKSKYDELIGMGIAPAQALNMAYGRRTTKTSFNPETGALEIYEGYGDEKSKIKPLREQEAKFGLYASQALDAHERLVDLEKQFNPASGQNAAFTMLRETPLVGRFGELIPNEEMKQYEAEIGRVIDGWARAMTGAAMPESERVFYKTMIGARPGDGPEVQARKARNREMMSRSLQAGAGGGAEIIEKVRAQMVDPYQDQQNDAAESEGWSEQKEQRYQELKRKQQEGALQ